MILGKSGKLPGALAPEIIELAKSKGYEFTDEDPQMNYPDELDKYRKEMDDNGWEYGEDEEELFELAMHDRQYRDYKSGVAKKRFMDDLQRAQDAAMVKSGFDEETIRKYKRTKADPIIAPDKGQILWEVSVEGPSIAPFVGRKYQHDEVFCYISTPWGEYEKIFANFTRRIVEVCADDHFRAHRQVFLGVVAALDDDARVGLAGVVHQRNELVEVSSFVVGRHIALHGDQFAQRIARIHRGEFGVEFFHRDGLALVGHGLLFCEFDRRGQRIEVFGIRPRNTDGVKSTSGDRPIK